MTRTDEQPVVPHTTGYALPPGFRPESIAIGAEPVAYLGSLADGALHRLDLVTGAGRTLVEPTGSAAGGLAVDDRGRLFVADAFAGSARVIDTATGAVVQRYQLADEPGGLVADVVITPTAALFSDARRPVLYRLPLGPQGALPDPAEVERVPLGRDIDYEAGFNLCGLAPTPDGAAVLAVQANTGRLFRIAPNGRATQVDLGAGISLVGGDGLLLRGRRLFVAQGLDNVVTTVELSCDGTIGLISGHIRDGRFDVPTAIAEYEGVLYLPNARFGTPCEPTTRYEVLAVRYGL